MCIILKGNTFFLVWAMVIAGALHHGKGNPRFKSWWHKNIYFQEKEGSKNEKEGPRNKKAQTKEEAQ